MTVMWVSPWRPWCRRNSTAQMLRQPHQDRPGRERLVRVVADVLDLEHHVAAAEPREVQFVAALEKAAGGAQPQAAQPDLDEALHIRGHVGAVADVGHHGGGDPLQVAEGGVAPAGVRRARARGGRDPTRAPRSSGSVLSREDLRERLRRLKRGQEQGADQVDMCLQGKARDRFQRVEAGGRRILGRPAGSRPRPGRTRRCGRPSWSTRLSRLHDQPRAKQARLASVSRCRTVCN